MTYLLDVNLLYILHQPLHVNYDLVRSWFAHIPDKRYSTCPVTQTGLLRLLIQGVAGLDSFRSEEARNALQHFVAQPGHVFWPDSPDYLSATDSVHARMQGHRQITDAYLLGLAIHNRGKLVTLDRGIRHLAGEEFAGHVEFIEPKISMRRSRR